MEMQVASDIIGIADMISNLFILVMVLGFIQLVALAFSVRNKW